jgi:hypothetical protein
MEATTMRAVNVLLMLGLLGLVLATPAAAAVALVTGSAPLEDESEEALQDALDQAVSQAVQDALSMGLRPVQLNDAQVWGDQVVVEILATDAQPDDGDDVPGLRPGEHLARSF